MRMYATAGVSSKYHSIQVSRYYPNVRDSTVYFWMSPKGMQRKLFATQFSLLRATS